MHDEAGPVPLHGRHVLDQAAERQLARGRALPRLLVVQVTGGVAQEVPGLGQHRQQVSAFARQGRGPEVMSFRLSNEELPDRTHATSYCGQFLSAMRAQSETWRTPAPAPSACSPSCRTTGSGRARSWPTGWASPRAPSAGTWTGSATSATPSRRTPAWTAATSWPRVRPCHRWCSMTRRPSPWRWACGPPPPHGTASPKPPPARSRRSPRSCPPGCAAGPRRWPP